MTNPQTSRFSSFAGQNIASGIKNQRPLVALETGVTDAVYHNLEKINSLMPKITDVLIHPTTVFTSPIEPIVNKVSSEYGAGMEQAAFARAAMNEKLDGKCVPMDSVNMSSQLDLVNFDFNLEVNVKDYEINKGVMNAEQAASYVANKMLTLDKGYSSLKYRAWVQLISDVIDGTRSINSFDSGNGINTKSGSTAVTYNPTITGYAGKVDNFADVIIPEVEVGTKVTITTPAEALKIVFELEAAVSDMMFESTDYNKLGIDTFSNEKPILVMERKVLDAMDRVFAEANAAGTTTGYGYAGVPTVSARTYLAGLVGQIIEIDAFAALPINASYENRRLGAVLLDKEALWEIIKIAPNVEGQRCSKDRSTGYSFQGESILSIWRGCNSYAQLWNTQH